MDMTRITPDKYFYARDGSTIKNLEELFETLQDMPENVFTHHVNEERNDFHSWVKDVFQNHNLAVNLKKSRTRDDMLKHVFVSLFR